MKFRGLYQGPGYVLNNRADRVYRFIAAKELKERYVLYTLAISGAKFRSYYTSEYHYKGWP